MSEVVEKLTEKIQGYPEGSYLKTWKFSNGKSIGISSNDGVKAVYICVHEEPNTMRAIGKINRKDAKLFEELFIHGGLFKAVEQ